MPIQNTDFLVINRSGVDYKAPASDLSGIVNAYANDGKLTIKDSAGNSLGTFTANQSGDTDITITGGGGSGGSINWDDIVGKPTVGDGVLTIKDSNNSTIATFTANQEGPTEVTIPAGSYDDLTNQPTIGDGILTIKNFDGSALGTFTANQTTSSEITLPSVSFNDLGDQPVIGDGTLTIKQGVTTLGTFTANQTTSSEINIADPFSGSWNDLTDVPTTFPPDTTALELDDLSDVTSAGTAGQVLTKAADGTHAFADPVAVPPALEAKGYIDVSTDSAPTADYGDLYQQHRADAADATAITGWTGIEGDTVSEGQYILFAADDEWHVGGQSVAVQVQSDWSEIDINSAAFILNKPDIGDGVLTINDSDGAELGTFSANQQTSSTITLPAGFSGDYNDLTNQPIIGDGSHTMSAGTGLSLTGDAVFTANQTTSTAVSYGIDVTWLDNQIDSNVNDGVLTINDSGGSPLGTFSANQQTASTITLPTVSYNDLADQPTIGDGSFTVLDHEGNLLVSFTANQVGNDTLNLPQGFSGDYDDLTNKPDLSAIGDPGIEEAPDTGFVYTRNGTNEEWVRGIPYDISTLPPLS